MKDSNKTVKIYLMKLRKKSSPEPIKLYTKHSWVKGINFYVMLS